MHSLEHFLNPDPFDVLAMRQAYIREFGDFEKDERPPSDEEFVSGGLALNAVERLTFEPDRLAAFINGIQEAIIRAAHEQRRGVIHVMDAGMGLGHLGVGALALNRALGGRVHFTGLESNPRVIARAREVFESYGLSSSNYSLIQADARTFQGVPKGTRVLAAEHLAAGFFTREPMLKVCRNLVPQLAPNPFLVPRGVGVYGRVLHKGEGVPHSSCERSDLLGSDVLDAFRAGSIKAVAATADGRDLCMDEGFWRQVVSDFPTILPATHITTVDFLKAVQSRWDGNVELKFSGMAERSGEGVVELRIVPWLNGEGPFVLGKEFLNFRRLYFGDITDGMGLPGTNLNQWDPAHHAIDIDRAMALEEGSLQHRFQEASSADKHAVKRSFQAGKRYGVRLAGPWDEYSAKEASIQEL